MTKLLHQPSELRSLCDAYRARGHRVGLVPTMGALHEGHLSLVQAVREAGADKVVATIFVNALQFAAGEDLDRYPRTLQADLELLSARGVDLAFAPDSAAMYPAGFQTHVEVQHVTQPWEGAFRPTHFRGVTTVVAKLFNMVGPCVAAFGRKDYQQWRTLCTMARDLNMPIEILGCPIIREADGLAMSSRNRYLSAEDHKRALSLYRGLSAAQERYGAGERDANALQQAVRTIVEKNCDRVDYVAAADAVTLEPIKGTCTSAVVILIAAHLGHTRLIDNLVLGEDAASSQC